MFAILIEVFVAKIITLNIKVDKYSYYYYRRYLIRRLNELDTTQVPMRKTVILYICLGNFKLVRC